MDQNVTEPADEFIHLPNRPRTGTVVSVRLPRTEADALHDRAERESKTISDVARDAIKAHLGRPTAQAQTSTRRQPC